MSKVTPGESFFVGGGADYVTTRVNVFCFIQDDMLLMQKQTYEAISLSGLQLTAVSFVCNFVYIHM